MIERLQQQLHDIYQTGPGYDIREFLVTDARVAQALSGGNTLTRSGETLLLQEDEEGVAVSLYLDDRILDRLDGDDPAAALRSGLLDDLCKVIEGLSHFNYVAWRASHDQTLSLLELELQAEIDKYVSTMYFALDEQDTDMLHGLHGQLFENVQFHAHLSGEQRERYRAASEYAARFCQGLKPRLVRAGRKTRSELRRFFRMPLTDKISHIHSSAWAES
ncbi:hypothetical protein [Elongatibacter sediminis]|uniref:Uncharacterized protein n=1 Tax=Elongatibacter sediminis TaxID=3119006 RepID=A0AAW9RAD4_9GAMM